jgi:hypothetical protein
MNGELSVVVAPRTFCLKLTIDTGELPRIQSVHMSPDSCTVCKDLRFGDLKGSLSSAACNAAKRRESQDLAMKLSLL